MGRPKSSHRETSPGVVSSAVIDRCKRGDEAAWAELVEATHRDVYTLCLRILRDPHDAAEATQDAYLRAWRGLNGFRGDAQFTTWLYRVASNAAISKQRSRKRRREHETAAEDETLSQLPARGSTEATVSGHLDMEALGLALSDLPEHYRSAVVLRDVYGLGIAEIAEQLHISEAAAKVRVHRGRKRLRDVLYPTGDS